MIKFHALDNSILSYGNEMEFNKEDEKAFLISFEKQLRTADLESSNDVSKLQFNFNEMANVMGVSNIPTHGVTDAATVEALNYYKNNREVFMKYGIKEHVNAKKVQKVTNPAFTETEYAPSIDEMKELEIDISELYNDRS
jgi:hypothetical protein